MSVKRPLSHDLGAIKRGRTVDTIEEGFPCSQVFLDVAAASATSLLTAQTLASGVATTVTSGIGTMAHYRCVSITGNQATVAGAVTIHGYDEAGRYIKENVTASGASTVQSLQAFRSVFQVDLPARVAVGDTISVGISDKLGLARPIVSSDDVILVERKATDATSFTTEGAPTVDASYDTVLPSGGITGNDSFKISFRTKRF